MAHKNRFVFTLTLLMGFYLALLLIIGGPPFGKPVSSTGMPHGIQGQMAPELNLSNWIDGHGRKTKPIRLSAYRGKVVYMYFFQDW